MRILVWIVRIALAALFFYSGAVKAGASEQFAVTIAQFSILPVPWIAMFAIVLPFMEILAAILLVLPWTARLGAWLVSALLILFMSALGWALQQGLIVDCGCFGESLPSKTKMILALVRDAVLLAATLGLAARRPPRPAPPE